MKTPKDGRKLSRNTSHRISMLRNMALNLFKYEKIVTTYPKAKELEKFASKLITTALVDNLNNRRSIFRYIKDKDIVKKLFEVISKRYTDRKGGYISVIKSGRRFSDGALMAVIRLVQ